MGSGCATTSGETSTYSTKSDPARVIVPGGGLHADLSIACSGCAAVVRQVSDLLDHPPVHATREVTERDEATGATRTVPYTRSRRYLDETLKAACTGAMLTRFERKLTWLGDVTFHYDTVPWDPRVEEARARASRVDPDLALVCRRATTHYGGEILDAAARGRPIDACLNLGCGRVPPALEAVAETTVKLATRPAALLKLAPVFVMAFVFPMLFIPMIFPPKDPVNVKEDAAREEKRAATGRDEDGDGGNKKTR